jgi:hypothetical protein
MLRLSYQVHRALSRFAFTRFRCGTFRKLFDYLFDFVDNYSPNTPFVSVALQHLDNWPYRANKGYAVMAAQYAWGFTVGKPNR